MLFNSITFAVFLPIIFGLYWAVGAHRLRLQNTVILIASYYFYGFWDARFLALILLSSGVDYYLGRAIHHAESQHTRRRLLWLSCSTNLGLLGIFKYFNFFVQSAKDALSALGYTPPSFSLEIILPVGISFYTFQTLSYTIDIYRRELEPEEDPIAFFAFVSFFPQLVAGPIERARDLLPQFTKQRVFRVKYASEGLRQMLFGLFKKVVIADNLAPVVEASFETYAQLDGVTLAMAAFLFSIQLYCDFSGYSDIAIGTAKLLGIKLSRNFAYPYFATTMRMFWRRWHISLSSWFRDYVYIPLGGVRVEPKTAIRNVLIVFMLSGLWHGAAWHFVFWGLLNGLYTVPALLRKPISATPKTQTSGLHHSMVEVLYIVRTLFLWSFSLIFFRAATLADSFGYIAHALRSPWVSEVNHSEHLLMSGVGVGLLILEWLNRQREHTLAVGHLAVWLRWPLYLMCCLSILVFGAVNGRDFVYFQF